MASRSHSFVGVSVGLPSKVRGSEAEEEWQEVDWVTWSTGDVSIDVDSFLLIFKPSGSGGVKAKPLGNLMRASTVGSDDDSQRTLVVTTSDPVHGQYRFTFEKLAGATEFKKLSDAVEAAHAAAAAKGAQASSRSSSGNLGVGKLATAIEDKYAGRWPLTFGAAELYGPSLSGERGSEVLLGRGVATLLDPAEDTKTVGQYSLLFFGEDEGASQVVKSFTIGSHECISLKRQQVDVEDEDGPAAMFEIVGAVDKNAHMISFDDAATAAMFARDFRVRARLMDVSLKTAKGKRAVSEARGEIAELKRRSLSARLMRFVGSLVLIIAVAICVRAGLLYKQQPQKDHLSKADYITKQLKQDVEFATRILKTFATEAGTKACELAGGMVSLDSLEKCLSVGGVSKVHECVAKLARISAA